MLRVKPPRPIAMPVTLEFLTRRSLPEQPETDSPDLVRLAQDMSDCPCYGVAWAEWQAAQVGMGLYVARFNGRIVGACLLQQDCLLSLGVPAITRGWGVGQRMVTVLAQRRRLSLSPLMTSELAAFVSACGVLPATR
jgi:hypothetical protein